MDANEIIPRLRALGSRKFSLDPRLVTMLDVDLRVVIEWNTGASDMDLWVDQPDGERSIYSNPETDIGGRLSNDMTSGYGPEEYLLRRAIDGEYAVRVNVYATDVINPNGSTMVTAHLTRNFGRANQSSETMELELKPDEAGEKLVGRFNVGARNRSVRSDRARASAVLASNAEWPASGTMRRSASGHALCRSQALRIGQTTSKRPCTMVAGMWRIFADVVQQLGFARSRKPPLAK